MSTEPPRDRRPFVSIGTKTALWLCLVLAATGIVTALALSRQTRERLVDGKRTAAIMVADLFAASVAPALDFQDQDGVLQEVAKLEKNPEIVYVAVFMSGSSKQAAEWKQGGSQREAQVPAQSSTDVFSDHIEVSRVLSSQDGRALGALVVRVSLTHENERLVEARKRIIQSTAVVTFLAALGMLAIMRRVVTMPLRGLARAARGLERGKAEPVVVRANDEIGQLGGAFNVMAAAIVDRERRLAELNRELMQLLDGMRQGIVVFERGGVLRAIQSHEAQVIFAGTDIEGSKVQDLVYPGRRDVGAQAFEEWLAVAFVVGPEAWAEIDELAPKEVTIDGPSGERVLSLDFRPIEIDGRIERIMMLATDETERRRLERVVREQDEEHEKQMAAMRRLVAGGGQLLVAVLDRARERIAACEAIIQKGPPVVDSALVEELFQHVHSVKGESRAFDISVLESSASELEDFLAILRGRLREGQRLPLEQVSRDLSPRLASAKKAISRAGEMLVEASPIGEAILRQVTVQRDDLDALVRLSEGRHDELGRLVSRLASRPFGELLLGLVEAVPRWAAREGKRAHIDLDGRDVRVPAALARVLPDVLAHLVRNALAHGIETTQDRAAAGKEELAVIGITAKDSPDGPVLCVEDDGRGLDAGAVLDRARTLGLPGTDVSRLVLESGLSTAENSELAGHGVGLGAVREDLRSVGYNMTLHSSENGLKITMAPAEALASLRGGSMARRTGAS